MFCVKISVYVLVVIFQLYFLNFSSEYFQICLSECVTFRGNKYEKVIGLKVISFDQDIEAKRK